MAIQPPGRFTHGRHLGTSDTNSQEGPGGAHAGASPFSRDVDHPARSGRGDH